MARNTLKDSGLKRALKAYIVPPLIKKYQVVSIRALFNSKTLWGKRIQLENILKDNDKIVAFFSSVTATQTFARPQEARETQFQHGEYIFCILNYYINYFSKN
jgi:hypothetical protein